MLLVIWDPPTARHSWYCAMAQAFAFLISVPNRQIRSSRGQDDGEDLRGEHDYTLLLCKVTVLQCEVWSIQPKFTSLQNQGPRLSQKMWGLVACLGRSTCCTQIPCGGVWEPGTGKATHPRVSGNQFGLVVPSCPPCAWMVALRNNDQLFPFTSEKSSLLPTSPNLFALLSPSPQASNLPRPSLSIAL